MVVMGSKPLKSATSALKKPVAQVARKYSATKIRIFGSFARNEQRKNSDVDLIVKMPKKSTLFDLSGLKQDLQKALKRKVDVVTYDSIKPSLRANILRDAKSL